MTNSQMVIPIMEKRSGLYCWLYVSSLFFMGFFPLLMIFLLKQFQPISYLVSHLLYLFFLVLSGKAIRGILNIYKEFAKRMG